MAKFPSKKPAPTLPKVRQQVVKRTSAEQAAADKVLARSRQKLPDTDLSSFDEAPKKPQEPAKPTPAKVPTVIISGEGSMPLGAPNWRRVKKGEPIEVTAEEIAWLEKNDVEFKRA